MTGNKPEAIIKSAGIAASAINSLCAYWYAWVARVSKLKGLKSNVIGSSFIVSTKTNNPPAKR